MTDDAERSATTRKTVCTVAEARKAHEAGRARFVDARWYMPNDPRDARDAYEEAHLPGAVFLDIDAVTTPSSDHPHRMPSAEVLGRWMAAHGLTMDDLIIVYDDTGFFSAPRGWWMFASLGHQNVRVLGGGLNAWVAEGLGVERGEVEPAPVPQEDYQGKGESLATREDVKKALARKTFKVVDARPEGRFTGVAPEPRPGLSSGHMPGAINVPFATLLDEQGQLRSTAELADLLAQKDLSPTDDVIATCGSGITACIPLIAMAEVGWQGRLQLYDGSWIDWASQPDAEIAKLL